METWSEWVWGELEENNLYNNHFSEIYNKYSKINFDFKVNYLYIIFVYNIINKQFQIFIYNGLPESDFIYLINNLDKLS